MPDPLRARLDQLHDQWVTFADDPRTRLLVWNARDDERTMVDAFLEAERDPERAQTPDVFLQLNTPWTDQPGHGDRLAAELIAQAAELDWQLACAGRDIAALLSTLSALRTRLGERLLAVRLEPSAIHEGSYLLWLQRLVHAAPEGIRFLVVGGGYDVLAQAEPVRVREVPCELDMPSACEEVTDRAGGATPDNVFRRLLMKLNAQLDARQLEQARQTAQCAVALALEQGWPQLAATVQLIMGAAYTGHSQLVEAAAAYGEADRHALAAGEDGSKLRLVALLGGAGALFAARAYGPARSAYRHAAALALQLGDARSELDGHRMAALCSEQLGECEPAWSAGIDAMRAAAKLKPEERQHSTLSELGVQLARLFQGDARIGALREQLAQLARA